MRLRFAVLAIPAVLADRRAVEIVSGGGRTGWANNELMKVEPGRQRVVVASFPHAGFPGGRQEEFILDIEPCKRYYLNAQFESNLSPRFEIVVDQVETVPGCAAAKG